jgi:cytochrome c oxidase subunit IV
MSHKTDSHDHSHSHSPAEVAKHVKIYIGVFFALLVGTVITVWLNSVHFDNFQVTVAVALLVAVIKATLVACYFMHLISEKKMIYVILGFTAFFFVSLMFITLAAYADFPANTTTN